MEPILVMISITVMSVGNDIYCHIYSGVNAKLVPKSRRDYLHLMLIKESLMLSVMKRCLILPSTSY